VALGRLCSLKVFVGASLGQHVYTGNMLNYTATREFRNMAYVIWKRPNWFLHKGTFKDARQVPQSSARWTRKVEHAQRFDAYWAAEWACRHLDFTIVKEV